ncbi:hypothetical protein PG989_008024 [Apiospora arundinis]
MVLCLSAVTSSTVLLFYANNRPLTDYSFFISFNTLISILAAVARATLAFAVGSCLGQWKWNWFSMRPDTPIVFGSFEDASRGPLGSFWLLCRIRARHWVSTGAFVTLLMLGFEPFMQALIYYEGRLVHTQPQNAPSIGVSSRLDIGLSRRVDLPVVYGFKFTYQNKSYVLQEGTFRTEASPGFASALNRGFYSNDPRNVVLKGIKPEGEYLTHAIPYVSLTNIAKQTSIGVTGRREGYETTLDAYMSAKSLDNPGHTLTFSSLDTMIVAVGLIRAEPAYANETKGWNETQVIATECALYFCANAYRSGVRGGKLYEDIVASWSNRVPGSYFPSDNHDAWGDVYSAEYRNDMWHIYEQYINHSLSTTGAYHLLDDLQLQIPKEEVARYEVRDNVTLLFNVTQNTIESTLPIFKTFFSDPLIYGKSEFGTVTASTLYRSANLSETFAGAARAMTHWIRDNSNQTQAGTQEEWVLHIRVRWPYVTLPILVVLLGCGFVFLSMWETRRLRLRPWKTDMLATLAHALDADSREQLRRAARQGRTREEAKGMVLHFEDNNDEGLELKAHDDERPSD